jgi:hypothetical protein
MYEGAMPGSDDPIGPEKVNWIVTGSNGKIRFMGCADRNLTEAGEFGNNRSLKNWVCEIRFKEGTTGAIRSGFRCKAIKIISGAIDVYSKSFTVSNH